MPIDTTIADKTWRRYISARDNGHYKFLEKAEKCDRFVRGEQWAPEDLAALKEVRRPAMTINKILSTITNVMGEQINNRSEITFRPRGGAPLEVAEALTKVFWQISDNNKLDWLRSDMFSDGIITGRGFLDIRLGHKDNMVGEVQICTLNPKNVIIDPDAESYDPDQWSDVITTKWLTADDIAVLYNEEDADYLRGRSSSDYGHDSIQTYRDSFGGENKTWHTPLADSGGTHRNLRVIERQYRELDRQKHFVSQHGDTRPVPDSFDRNRIALFVEQFGFQVINKLERRIRWVTVCDNVVLHNAWSPYKHYTVVPYFPYFRHGHTIGLVENLLDPQEVLNKVTSQELHVINTTANSGYKVRSGALTNMTVEELERKGAQTGIVIEVNGDPDKDIQKIQPNVMPQGLDRVSFKAEEHIKTISGISDSMLGFDREDVAAKAIQAKRQAGSTNLVKPIDSLARTDHLIARNILALVQEFYTEERLITITKNSLTGESETIAVNHATPEGQIVNDLTLGEYDVIVSSVPVRETLEDSQFEQALALRQLGVQIPDSVLIGASRLQRKGEILRALEGDQQNPAVQEQKMREMRAQEAEVAKLEGEARGRQADADLKSVRAQKEAAQLARAQQGPTDTELAAQVKLAELGLKREELELAHNKELAEMQETREAGRIEAMRQAAMSQRHFS